MPFQNVNHAFDGECEQYSGITSTFPTLQAGSATISIMCRCMIFFQDATTRQASPRKANMFKETKLIEERHQNFFQRPWLSRANAEPAAHSHSRIGKPGLRDVCINSNGISRVKLPKEAS